VREIAWWVRATQKGGARKHEKKVFEAVTTQAAEIHSHCSA
jgi:hypothetical protein